MKRKDVVEGKSQLSKLERGERRGKHIHSRRKNRYHRGSVDVRYYREETTKAAEGKCRDDVIAARMCVPSTLLQDLGFREM